MSTSYVVILLVFLRLSQMVVNADGHEHSSHKNLLVIGTLDGSLHGIDSSNGHTIWNFSTGEPLVTSSLNQHLKESERILPSSEGELFLVDANTHSLTKLAYSVQELVTASPTSVKELPGVLLLGSKETKLYRVNAKTGGYQCESMEADICPSTESMLEPTTFLLGRIEYALSGLNLATGEIVWNLTVAHFTSFETEKQPYSGLERYELNDSQIALGTPGSSERWTSTFVEPVLSLYTLESGRNMANPTAGVIRTASSELQGSSFTKHGSAYIPKNSYQASSYVVFESIVEEQNINSELLILLWKTLVRFLVYNKTLLILIFSAISVGFLLGKIYERRSKKAYSVDMLPTEPAVNGPELLPMLTPLQQAEEVESDTEPQDSQQQASGPSLFTFMATKKEQAMVCKGQAGVNTPCSRFAENLTKESVEIPELKNHETEVRVTAEVSLHREDGKLTKKETRTHVTTYDSKSPEVIKFFETADKSGKNTLHIVAEETAERESIVVSSKPTEPEEAKQPRIMAEPISRFQSSFESPELIGRGGFGAVYRAKHKLDGREYAVKCIKLRVEDVSLIQSHKFMREVKAMMSLNSKHVVKYVTCWTEQEAYVPSESPRAIKEMDSSESDYSSELSLFRAEDESESFCLESDLESSSITHGNSKENLLSVMLYIQMEYCEGSTLKDYLTREERTINRDENFSIFSNLLKGVEYIHSYGVIHRDLKPANVFLGKDLKPKIGDFGLATGQPRGELSGAPRIRQIPSESSLLRSEVLSFNVGTPFYLAPEQEKTRNYDTKVDIFPLGLILLELSYKFCTDHERFSAFKKIREEHVLPDSFEAKYPHESALVRWMTSPNPKDRPSAAEVRNSVKILEWAESLQAKEEEGREPMWKDQTRKEALFEEMVDVV